MSPTTLPTVQRREGLAGRHVLAGMVGFFAIVFAVNGVLLYKALATHSGLVAQEPYRKGLNYNDRVVADERQRALGWTDEVVLDGTGVVTMTVSDALGRPVTGLDVSGYLGRPSTTQHDRQLRLSETAPGRYTAAAGGAEAGAWLLALEARVASGPDGAATGEPVYRLKRRLWLKP